MGRIEHDDDFFSVLCPVRERGLEPKRNMDTVNSNGRQKLHPNSRASVLYNRFEFQPIDEHTSEQIRNISKVISEILRLPLVLIELLIIVGFQCQQIYEQLLRELGRTAQHYVEQEEEWHRRIGEVRRNLEEGNARERKWNLEKEAAGGKKRTVEETAERATKQNVKEEPARERNLDQTTANAGKKLRKDSGHNTVPQLAKKEYPTR